ncbi:YkgJ family cysteine cluster protein [Methanospirillum sp. J.3.6.1-F.2.7.3]|uniref:YkgJ family cysteine cluster protein n=1 Tax=Methanospirillum purgamenti TaxID=2834276 RepID=A0A8E7EJ89_9EURY|nr:MULTISPECIES: YkgJ family cysteine cluster protein [Methanospirillum]MDX8549220.1 YkgJ family cysteine cluster protein [Methanospirillum hungatei]QVV88889.1 YkgJ family cysteine cluster protein [Methanospirillum sp. J.3.6.1-F.2.7.3]
MADPCNRCGKCCLHMRRYMLVERSIGDTQHFCHFILTKERFFARIGGEDLVRFRDSDRMKQYPDSCPFLRPGEDESFHCTIYSFRPDHCRRFFCA